MRNHLKADAVLLCFGAVASMLVAAVNRSTALSRTEAIQKADTYLLISYEVTSANVYPAIDCYLPGLGGAGLSKLAIGSYTGLPYSFRGGPAYTPQQIVGHLYGSPARGAGNSATLLASAPECVYQHTTGIDCSQFVSAAWSVKPRFTVFSFTRNTGNIALGLTSREYVSRADAFCVDVDNPAAHHIILFSDTVRADDQFFSHEASSTNPAHVASKLRVYQEGLNVGYHPWVSVKLKDDPASQITRFDIDPSGPSPIVRWATLIEDRTATFSIWRSETPAGPFVQISPDIQALGGQTSGAEYEFADAGGTGAGYYRLMEQETNGRVIQHGTRSFAESQAWLLQGR